MITKYIEFTDQFNWGRFLIGQLTDEELTQPSPEGKNYPQFIVNGITPRHLLIVDLVTNEGAFFQPGGLVEADLRKHQLWVCPLYPLMLQWVYDQYESQPDITAWPPVVHVEQGDHNALYRPRQQRES